MHHLTSNEKKSRWKVQNFANARNGQKKSGLNPVWFELDFARGIMNCVMPDRISHSISLLSQHMDQVICIYLLETLFFRFALPDIIYFQHSRLGEIHRKWLVCFFQCFFEPDIKQEGNILSIRLPATPFRIGELKSHGWHHSRKFQSLLKENPMARGHGWHHSRKFRSWRKIPWVTSLSEIPKLTKTPKGDKACLRKIPWETSL